MIFDKNPSTCLCTLLSSTTSYDAVKDNTTQCIMTQLYLLPNGCMHDRDVLVIEQRLLALARQAAGDKFWQSPDSCGNQKISTQIPARYLPKAVYCIVPYHMICM